MNEQIKAHQKAIEIFDKEKIRMIEQITYLRGSVDKIDWSIKALQQMIINLQQEQQQMAVMEAARAQQNVGAHPSIRSENLQQRKKESSEKI